MKNFMVDGISSAQQPVQSFTTLKYTTKDGEQITATKQDGIVTLSGDKNGVRQMPLEDFIKKELVENLKEIKLEKSPEADTVELSTATTNAKPPELKYAEDSNVETSKDSSVPAETKKLDVVA